MQFILLRRNQILLTLSKLEIKLNHIKIIFTSNINLPLQLLLKPHSHIYTLIMGEHKQLLNANLLLLGHQLLHRISQEDISNLVESVNWPGQDPVNHARLH